MSCLKPNGSVSSENPYKMPHSYWFFCILKRFKIIIMETTTIPSPPRTLLEVFKSLPEGTLAQLIKNNLVMTPAPLFRHQDTQRMILESLYAYLSSNPAGKLWVAPLDVYLDEENVFQPDILFIRKENSHIIREDGIYGAPDIIIEILSPSTAHYDLNEKKHIYERSGVQEYHVVDPDNKETKGFFLKSGKYAKPVQGQGKITSKILNHDFTF